MCAVVCETLCVGCSLSDVLSSDPLASDVVRVMLCVVCEMLL